MSFDARRNTDDKLELLESIGAASKKVQSAAKSVSAFSRAHVVQRCIALIALSILRTLDQNNPSVFQDLAE
jgi:hypothetical protein